MRGHSHDRVRHHRVDGALGVLSQQNEQHHQARHAQPQFEGGSSTAVVLQAVQPRPTRQQKTTRQQEG